MTFLGKVIVLLGIAIYLPSYAAGDDLHRETLQDGVEHWSFRNSSTNSSRFFAIFQQVFDVEISNDTTPPFGKSAALLVGVSSYKHLSEQLPSVTNDLTAMREFLLLKGGFDDVFIMQEGVVTRDLIEEYVKSVIPTLVGKHGRALFYYSGHGADGGGKTGYMQFANAKAGQTWGASVLAIKDASDWSNEVNVKHMLFIFDCCVSGLAFTSKDSSFNSARVILNTLSGDGSRAVMTAGTSEEPAYALEARNSWGNGVLTHAFLSAFERARSEKEPQGILTLAEVYAAIQREMAIVGAEQKVLCHPRLWPLQEADFRGTFVFLDPRVQKATLDEQQRKVLNIPLNAKGSAPSQIVNESGIIQFTSYVSGMVFIDDVQLGKIEKGETRQFLYQEIGKHRLELRTAKPIFQEVNVTKGEVVEVIVTPGADRIVASPIASQQGNAKGSLKFRIRGQSGDVFIDGFKMGYLVENEELLIENLKVGKHEYRIGNLVLTPTEFFIEKDKITQIGTPTLVPPPSNLRIAQ